jgi:hypothetical protein
LKRFYTGKGSCCRSVSKPETGLVVSAFQTGNGSSCRNVSKPETEVATQVFEIAATAEFKKGLNWQTARPPTPSWKCAQKSTTWCQSYKTFFHRHQRRYPMRNTIYPRKAFLPCLIFEGKARCLPSGGPAISFSTRVGLGLAHTY